MWLGGEGIKYVQEGAKIQYIMEDGGRRLVGLQHLCNCGLVGGQDVLPVTGKVTDSMSEWNQWINHARSTQARSNRVQVLRTLLQAL